MTLKHRRTHSCLCVIHALVCVEDIVVKGFVHCALGCLSIDYLQVGGAVWTHSALEHYWDCLVFANLVDCSWSWLWPLGGWHPIWSLSTAHGLVSLPSLT